MFCQHRFVKTIILRRKSGNSGYYAKRISNCLIWEFPFLYRERAIFEQGNIYGVSRKDILMMKAQENSRGVGCMRHGRILFAQIPSLDGAMYSFNRLFPRYK